MIYIIGTVTLSLLGAVRSPDVPHGSFLLHHVRSTKELVHQWDTNPIVRLHFKKAFQRDEAVIREAILKLRLKRLERDTEYAIGFYRNDGSWGFRPRLILAGTKVFVRPSGEPFLLQACGNLIASPALTARQRNSPIAFIPPDLEIPLITIASRNSNWRIGKENLRLAKAPSEREVPPFFDGRYSTDVPSRYALVMNPVEVDPFKWNELWADVLYLYPTNGSSVQDTVYPPLDPPDDPGGNSSVAPEPGQLTSMLLGLVLEAEPKRGFRLASVA